MAINKNSNGFTFLFAIIMVVIVGGILGFVSQTLKPLQEKNSADKKMIDVVKSIGVKADRTNAADVFGEYVIERLALDMAGNVVLNKSGVVDPKDKEDPFNIDVKKDYKNKIFKVVKKHRGDLDAASEDMNNLGIQYPLYKCSKEGEVFYVIPVSGTGLWGPIWGYVALADDYETIYGVAFDHEGETPGLGAEIKETSFGDKFTLELKTINTGEGKAFDVLKAGKKTNEHSVDGVTGGTITSVAVGEMLDRTFKVYNKYFETLK